MPEFQVARILCSFAVCSSQLLHQLNSENSRRWEYVSVYADEALTGTKETRQKFNRMLEDCKAGKIDMIITKAISRFARNTVATLEVVRELKCLGIDIYFEKENIYTLDSKGELRITIMGSLAQEESRSISENKTWGQRKRFADGKISLSYKKFLGYEKGEDGTPKINEIKLQDGLITEFDVQLWYALIEKVIVNRDDSMKF